MISPVKMHLSFLQAVLRGLRARKCDHSHQKGVGTRASHVKLGGGGQQSPGQAARSVQHLCLHQDGERESVVEGAGKTERDPARRAALVQFPGPHGPCPARARSAWSCRKTPVQLKCP